MDLCLYPKSMWEKACSLWKKHSGNKYSLWCHLDKLTPNKIKVWYWIVSCDEAEYIWATLSKIDSLWHCMLTPNLFSVIYYEIIYQSMQADMTAFTHIDFGYKHKSIYTKTSSDLKFCFFQSVFFILTVVLAKVNSSSSLLNSNIMFLAIWEENFIN